MSALIDEEIQGSSETIIQLLEVKDQLAAERDTLHRHIETTLASVIPNRAT